MPLGHLVEELFTPEPAQWGLRGDPHLWRAVRGRIGSSALPETVVELDGLLRAAICDVLGTDWAGFRAQQQVFHESLAHGGMSSGYVSVPTWTDRLIPLLCERAALLLRYSWANPR